MNEHSNALSLPQGPCSCVLSTTHRKIESIPLDAARTIDGEAPLSPIDFDYLRMTASPIKIKIKHHADAERSVCATLPSRGSG